MLSLVSTGPAGKAAGVSMSDVALAVPPLCAVSELPGPSCPDFYLQLLRGEFSPRSPSSPELDRAVSGAV